MRGLFGGGITDAVLDVQKASWCRPERSRMKTFDYVRPEPLPTPSRPRPNQCAAYLAAGTNLPT